MPAMEKRKTMFIVSIVALINFDNVQHVQMQGNNMELLPWKRFCKIVDVEARCSGHGKDLSYIPNLPIFVQKLRLDSNYFRTISAEILLPISEKRMNITELSVKSSRVHYVGRYAFKNVPRLKSLDLTSNVKLNLSSLKNSFASMHNQNLSQLRFTHMAWTHKSLSFQLFVNLSHKRIDRIILNNNRISHIPNSSLEGLQRLRILDLHSNNLQNCDVEFASLYGLEDLNLNENRIKDCNIVHLPKRLRILRLGNNLLQNVPLFCSATKEPLLPILEKLIIRENLISVLTRFSFDCLENLTHLDMSKNNIRHFRSHVFHNLLNLEDLKLRSMKLKVTRIEEGSFSIPSLRKLYFDHNFYEFNTVKRIKRASLVNCTKLEILDISSNYLPKYPRGIGYVLNGLTKVRKLYLERVYWNEVPNNLFKIMPNIEEVDLSSNRITNLSRKLFLKESKIVRMKLHNNRIAHVGPETFPDVFWRSIKTIDLSANPYVCNCDLLWFRDLLWNSKDKKITIKRYPKGYKCLMPPELEGLKLADFNMTSEECKKKSELKVAMISSGSVILSGLVVIFTVYKCRWHIRYWIYLLRYQRKDYDIRLSESFNYDGFIIYSEDDCDFVHNSLLTKLESELGCRMCVHYRDFQVGKMIVDNIVECMSQSRHALVVISKTFCQSKWCNFEMLLAHDRWLRNESGALIIVMMEEVKSRHMTKDLRALIQTTTYCSWTKNEVGQKLFWEQLFSSLKKG